MNPFDLLVKRGSRGWIILAAYIVIWDNLAHARRGQTLSDAFWVGLTSKYKWRRALVFGCWAVVTSHLLFKTPLPVILPRMFPELKEMMDDG